MPNAGLDTGSETKEKIEKRVLEAQKVVVSNFLHEWRRKYGMDYLIMVRNEGESEEVFSRWRISDKNRDIMAFAVAELMYELRDTVSIKLMVEKLK